MPCGHSWLDHRWISDFTNSTNIHSFNKYWVPMMYHGQCWGLDQCLDSSWGHQIFLSWNFKLGIKDNRESGLVAMGGGAHTSIVKVWFEERCAKKWRWETLGSWRETKTVPHPQSFLPFWLLIFILLHRILYSSIEGWCFSRFFLFSFHSKYFARETHLRPCFQFHLYFDDAHI